MNLTGWRMRFLMLSCFVSILLGSAVVSLGQVVTPSRIPNPIVYFMGQEPFQTSGKSYVRYTYAVFNLEAFPNTLFTATPDLPPCGRNTRPSRTWVDLYDQTGKRLNGFCALGSNKDLGKVWFALEEGNIPPSYIYIELNDRQTQTKYKSNLAETTM
ncbi:MAG TPA: hypothetical protein VFR80_02995 [Pyrinomonadaceae bacterium]|nr:hypothetical protein [Pyrinomonadaceae bacterium]